MFLKNWDPENNKWVVKSNGDRGHSHRPAGSLKMPAPQPGQSKYQSYYTITYTLDPKMHVAQIGLLSNFVFHIIDIGNYS